MDPLLIAGGALVGVALGMAVLAVGARIAVRGGVVRDRMQRAIAGTAPAEAAVLPAASRDAGVNVWARLLAPFARISKPKEQSEDFSRIKLRLSHAAIRNPHAVEIFYGAKLALALLFAGSVLVVNALRTTALPNLQVFTILAAAVGFYGPSVWLHTRVKKRQQAVSRSLPDALDLLVTCVEAGLGLEAALLRITREIGLSAPELEHELRLTNGEMQAGVRRAEAFRHLAERTGLDDLRSLSAMLIQTEMFGTSIAQALRVHSSAIRVRRTHRAEEKAATVSVKMLLPLVVFILPSLFSVILGPAVVRIAKTLLPVLGGEGQ